MLRTLTWLLILTIFGAIGYDYVKNNVDIDAKIDEVAMLIEGAIQEEMPVTVEPSNSAVIPVDSATPEQVKDTVTSAQELADATYYHVSRYNPQFTIHFKGDTSQLESIIQQAYALIEERDPYIHGHLSDRNIEYTYTASRATLNFNQKYLTTYEQERLVNGKVAAILETIDASTMTDVEKVKIVNDYIVQHTVYSEATSASPHSAYAILFEGKGVCQGYALLAYKLLTELGIEALYVTGEVYTGGHAWNLVKLDGNWHHLDTTWNDPLPDRGNGVSYDYFLITDSQMSKDHTWDLTKYPRATTQMSF
ncbi:MAG: transglutaminase domain-containing protein [Lysinibacillus sp.]